MEPLPFENAATCRHEKTVIIDADSEIHKQKEVCEYCAKFIRWVAGEKSTPKRDNNNKWRAAWKERGEFVCLLCGIKESETKMHYEVHHMRPLSEGGEDILKNTAMVCKSCHDLIHIERKRVAYMRRGAA